MMTYLPTTMLDALVTRFKPKNIVEVGTYYAGWTTYLETITDAKIWSLQSTKKLNHLDNSTDGEYSDANEAWKKVSNRLDDEYHGRYDFNLLARNLSKLKNTTCMLIDSPPNFNWFMDVDITIIDCSRNPEELKKHFDYWIKYSKVVALGHYKTTSMEHDEQSEVTYDNLFKHCENNGRVEHYSKNYIWIMR